jgi:hypothetical protein
LMAQFAFSSRQSGLIATPLQKSPDYILVVAFRLCWHLDALVTLVTGGTRVIFFLDQHDNIGVLSPPLFCDLVVRLPSCHAYR